MTNIVIIFTQNELLDIQNYYNRYTIERKAPGVVFAAKLPDTTITIYKSGKCMFQGTGAEREAARFSTQQSASTPTPKTKGDQLPEEFSNMSVIGSDETGTGDYFGPITVAAVYVPSNKIALLTELGVKDSKMLTDHYMRQIAPHIKAACIHSIEVLHNEKYNDIQTQGYSQGKMKAVLHNNALKNVLYKMEPDLPQYILIDQFAERNTYFNYLKGEQDIVRDKVLFATKAEQLHIAVAAASILARNAFLEEMDQLSATVGVELQKGASNKVDQMAARIWQQHGEETLRSITKWHFANTEKARKLLRK